MKRLLTWTAATCVALFALPVLANPGMDYFHNPDGPVGSLGVMPYFSLTKAGDLTTDFLAPVGERALLKDELWRGGGLNLLIPVHPRVTCLVDVGVQHFTAKLPLPTLAPAKEFGTSQNQASVFVGVRFWAGNPYAAQSR